MHAASINVGRIREVEYRGHLVRTGIFKSPVSGPVRVRRLGIDGDEQADLKNHGGDDMAVYCYSAENYDYWRHLTPALTAAPKGLPFGTFGENLAVVGLDDRTVHIGDRFRIGAKETGPLLEASVPRAPCSKLAMVMDSTEFVKTFLESLRLGWYTRVIEEGVIAPGDPISREHTDPARLSIESVSRVMFFDTDNREAAEFASNVMALSPKWRAKLAERARTSP